MPAINNVEKLESNITDPAKDAAAVIPNDDRDLLYVSRALFIGGAGSLTVVMYAGQIVTFNVLAGLILPIRVARVLATGTTATDIVAVW